MPMWFWILVSTVGGLLVGAFIVACIAGYCMNKTCKFMLPFVQAWVHAFLDR
jgi:hypothetical protein